MPIGWWAGLQAQREAERKRQEREARAAQFKADERAQQWPYR